MLRQTVNRLQGQVQVRVECPFPERILNLCSARDLAFWDLAWESPECFTCWLTRKDYAALRQAVRKVDCVLTPVGRQGAPYFFRRLRRRHVLAAGAVLCALWLGVGSFFIWDFTVEGNETVPTEEILRSLERNGVTLGTFCFQVDSADLRNHVLLEIPRLSWIAVNVAGCRAYVQVRERKDPPRTADRRQPANTVARRDGLVLEMRALEGISMVLPGDTVAQGQLLISGVADTDTFGARVLGGVGEVTARTWYSLQTAVPLETMQKRESGGQKRRFSLVLGKRRIKFFPNSSIRGANYDKITKRSRWSLFGLALPVTGVEEIYTPYETRTLRRSVQEAERLGEEILTEYLHTQVDPYGTVTSTLCTAKQQGDALLVTLKAECRERIEKTVPVYTDTQEKQE